jgi:hypothetical protein
MSTINIGIPQGKIHLIWTHYIHSTNIYNVMRRVLREFLTSNARFSLTPVEDAKEIDLLLETMNLVYPAPPSPLIGEFGYEQLLLNMLQRVFGIDNKMLRFPRSQMYNSGFKLLLESIFLNIAQAIWSKGSTFQLLRDPGALLEGLISLKEMLLPAQTNTVEKVNRFWADSLIKLLTLLDNRKLMVEKIGIVASGRDKMLYELGTKFGFQMPNNILWRFDLANYLNTFLLQVEGTEWDVNLAETLYDSDNFFKLLFSAYSIVERRDFKREGQFILSKEPQRVS